MAHHWKFSSQRILRIIRLFYFRR